MLNNFNFVIKRSSENEFIDDNLVTEYQNQLKEHKDFIYNSWHAVAKKIILEPSISKSKAKEGLSLITYRYTVFIEKKSASFFRQRKVCCITITVVGKERAYLKKTFSDFNRAFEDLHQTCSRLRLTDIELQQQIRKDVAVMMVNNYAHFLSVLTEKDFTNNKDKYFIYATAEDLKNAIFLLFDN